MAHSVFLLTLCALRSALCPFEDHFRNCHPDFFIRAHGLPDFLLKDRHIAVKRRSIKFEMLLVAATAVKGPATRATNRVYARALATHGGLRAAGRSSGDRNTGYTIHQN